MKNRLVIFLGLVAAAVAFWAIRTTVRTRAVASTETRPGTVTGADSPAAAPHAAAAPAPPAGAQELPWLPTTPRNSRVLGSDPKPLQEMRRPYLGLERMKRLGEIQAVGAAMKLPPATIEKLMRWTNLRFDKIKEMDSVPMETNQQEAAFQGKVYFLAAANKKAVERLLGNQYGRYQQLLLAYRSDRLEEELRGEKPKGETITIDERPPGPPPDTSMYDSMFR